MKAKVCKQCKIFIEGEKCPVCQGNQFTETWKGKVQIINPEQSEIARKLQIKQKGIYAIKTR